MTASTAATTIVSTVQTQAVAPPTTDGTADDPTAARPANGGQPADQPIYHNSTNWRWLAQPSTVVPGVQTFNTDANTSCSAGYFVTSADGRRFNLTAGHCGQRGNSIYVDISGQGSTYFGSVTDSGYTSTDGQVHEDSDHDYGLVSIDGSAAKWSSAMPFAQKLSGYLTADQLATRRPRICRLGARTGLSCGAMVAVNDDGYVTYRSIADHGDSGGPVFAMIGDALYAVGVDSSGEDEDATLAAAQLIAPAIQHWGLTLNG